MSIQDILEKDGVNSKGYGIISQAVMFDRNLSATSKAIYAYFSSYLGAGRTAFPKTETILSHLKISKNTYYKHFNPLVKNGYIRVSKAKGFLNRNIYTITNNVPELKKISPNDKNEKSLLLIDGINAFGYGFIPKLIMTDERLSVKAKALIAFLYSLAQGGCQAYPHRTTICSFLKISKNSYYTFLNELIACDYLSTKQRHIGNGCFSVTDFILHSNPKSKNKSAPCPKNCDNGKNGLNTEFSPCPKNCDNEKNGLNTEFSPCPQNCDYGNDDRVPKIATLPCPKNCDNNNSTIYNNISYISPSNLQVDIIPYMENEEEIRNTIYELTLFDDYSIFNSKDNEQRIFNRLYRNVVNTLVEMLSKSTQQKYSNEYVCTRDIFVRLNDCIEEDTYSYSLRDLIISIVLNYQLAQERYDIKCPDKYLRSFIWDAIKKYE